ncbi:3',5'-cyclic-nucleotide phosphodiesterase [Chryseobacterium sp. B21-037]|uniref:MBL fold metallo-hydrolase n=1 Tax=unclassified Chryseobacterium TaxID=2593645 RepID=UPI0023591630|nr:MULTISPECIES: 3',5'-cyclic-nucleotide phosphodiesterase [unclassified Chryseobacterium]MDC8103748.1 3',5'-cyclic-nucleotide phosphodiesterase [Chryseobacterium sp. B21-037]MDQ1803356.1 3',5'-cyclic-nucleotide phosphodiesterase [Chryseobacterium sp. CKR4-1]
MIKQFFSLAIILSTAICSAQNSFKVIPLGIYGGGYESNLSSYMAAPVHSDNYITLDAGTIRSGIEKAIEKGNFKQNSALQVIQQNIKGYLISHAHLDHVSGLIINSPDDTKKSVYTLPSVGNIITDKYFSWQSWANFTDTGETPRLGKYKMISLEENREIPLTDTEMYVTAFPLSHVNPYESTAFLLRYNDDYLLYLGDTGSDRIEKSNKLEKLWKQVAPHVNKQKLKGILIEVSFPNAQPDKSLFGHLTPALLENELNILNGFCQPGKLKNVPVIITHLKPVDDSIEKIKKQLKEKNTLGIRYIFPVQGEKITL